MEPFACCLGKVFCLLLYTKSTVLVLNCTGRDLANREGFLTGLSYH